MRLTSLQNPGVKEVVKLRQRSHRDASLQMIVEGYREIRRALDNRHQLTTLYVCPEFYLGKNETTLVADAAAAGAVVIECDAPVFAKLSYRDRPEGLLAIAPQLQATLADLHPPAAPLLIVAEAIEKPGNLGTILRSADAAGAHAVIVADPCTDIHNPNVVRASIGTLFSVPLAVASSDDTLAWLRVRQIRILAATPHTDTEYFDADLRGGVAIVVGTEQYGLSEAWLQQADVRVRIPMKGQADSLNVAAATVLLMYEAVRQRRGM